jgi:hypothetical protein
VQPPEQMGITLYDLAGSKAEVEDVYDDALIAQLTRHAQVVSDGLCDGGCLAEVAMAVK